SPPPEPDYLHRSLTISTGASSCRDSGQPVDSPRDPGIVSERLGRPHTRTNARFLLTTMVALVVALPGPAGARTVLPDGTGGDHPLTRSFVLYGRIDAYVTGLAHNSLPNPYGTFTVSGLPQGASIKKALLYLTDWA